MSNKICLVIPYFGKLPQYVNLFIKTASFNENLDFIFFTDCDLECESTNIRIIKTSLENIKRRAQEIFLFRIKLEKPYKLCDFKPAYGLLFQEYLKSYTFWGYCDIDIAFGNTTHFLTEDLLGSYDKIYQHGHFTLYRNTYDVNHEFMSDYGMDYRKVFSSNVNCIFDELDGVQRKFDHDGYRTYKGIDFFDAYPWNYHIRRASSGNKEYDLKPEFDYKNETFSWEHGNLYREAFSNGKIIRNELLYFHFQKRKFEVPDDVLKSDSFYLANEGIVSKYHKTSVEDIGVYNAFSDDKELAKQYEKNKYLWKRRFNKYVLHRGG